MATAGWACCVILRRWASSGDNVIRNLGSGTALTCCDSSLCGKSAPDSELCAVPIVRRRQRHLLRAGPLLLGLLRLRRRGVKAPALGRPMLGRRPLLQGNTARGAPDERAGSRSWQVQTPTTGLN